MQTNHLKNTITGIERNIISKFATESFFDYESGLNNDNKDIKSIKIWERKMRYFKKIAHRWQNAETQEQSIYYLICFKPCKNTEMNCEKTNEWKNKWNIFENDNFT